MPDQKQRHTALIATLLLSTPVAVLLTWPQLLGAQQWPLIAQLIALRAPLAIGLAVCAVIAALVAIARRRWAIAAGLAVTLGAASLGGGAVLLTRGWGGSEASGAVTVLVWNTQGGASSPRDVAQLVLETDADIVSLPEMDEAAVDEVARLLTVQGRKMAADTTRAVAGSSGESWIPTSVLISERLGEYRLDAAAGSTPRLPSGVWRPIDGSGPTIAAVHPYPPLPAHLDAWSSGLRWVADLCDDDVIVAGDLNATLDHLAGLGTGGSDLGGCRDAALEAGAAAAGTWPSTVPVWLAAPIDHVLVGSAWTVRAAHVVTDTRGASDHRALVAVLDPR